MTVDEVFEAAVKMTDERERRAFVEKSCEGDEQKIREIASRIFDSRFEELRSRFEGKQGIYVEYGAYSMRPFKIERRGQSAVLATAEILNRPGFPYPNGVQSPPQAWHFGGALMEYSD